MCVNTHACLAEPAHKLFPDEQEPVPLVEDPPTATLAESQEQEGVFSLSVPVYEPDGMGAVSHQLVGVVY